MKPRAQPHASPCLAPLWLALLMLAALPASADDAERGAALYGDKCARCHDGERERTPPRRLLAERAPEEVVSALTAGSMRSQAAGMSVPDIDAVATFLTGRPPRAAMPAALPGGRCPGDDGAVDLAAPQWNGWGRDLENSRYQPGPGLTLEDVPRLKVKWAFAYPGAITYGQPTIVGHWLYVSSITGAVYGLDARTGCIHWSIEVGTEVRSAITVGAGAAPGTVVAYFGDGRAVLHAVDAASGASLWETKLDAHEAARVSGSPVLHQGRLYVGLASREEGFATSIDYRCCSFRGSVSALEAATGKLLWKTFTIVEEPKPYRKSATEKPMLGPAGAAVWATPTLDAKRELIYAATGNSYTEIDTAGTDAIIALDLATGAVRWTRQTIPRDNYIVGCADAPGAGNCPNPPGPDFDFGSSPILQTLPDGKQLILAGQKSGVVYALDPDDGGRIVWETRLGKGGALGGIEWGPAADLQNIYAAISDLARNPDQVPGGLTALNLADGKRVWQTPAPAPVCSWGPMRCSRAQSAAVTAIPGVVFSGSLDGHLRGYATQDGAIIWDFDTAKSYDTVNGAAASGGSLDTAGPTVADGMLYVNSGYGRFWGHRGNVLLAFSVAGK
jgi:polyvinyl alcohol dehydrogenase (cytochrome)